jgi:hypothetical protein
MLLMSYNLLDLRSRVRSKIKDSSYSASTIDGFINDAIVEIADLYPWVYFQKLVSGALTVGENTYTQQSDHQITTKLVMLHPTQTTSNWDITGYRKPWEEFFELYPAPDTLSNSQPTYWTEYGNQLYFNCPSDLAYLLRQYYQKIPTELAADADVPELPQNFREAIVLGAAYRCEEERDNYDIAGVLQNRFNDRVSDLMTRFANDTMTGPDTVIMPGLRRDDW